MNITRSCAGIILFLMCYAQTSFSQSISELRFDIGSPTVVDYYVDPENGRDSNNGRSESNAFKTLTEAWNQIPQSQTLTTGYRINILSGTIPESGIPNYMESKHGSFSAPIIIKSKNGRGTVTLAGDLNIFDTRYLYLMDLVIDPNPAGDALHCEQCKYLLIKNSELSGGSRSAHETIKINQSDHVYIEDSNIHGADDNVIDFVAVQYGHIARNKIHNAQDWCAYAKGGSAYLRVESNEIYDCGTGGFTAGQGTGFEFMTSPWLHYEAYDMKIINNIIHDTEGAGLGVNGGYNILLAHNTLYKVGSRSHTIEVVFGSRSCDGNSSACQDRLNLGGWGTAQVGGDTTANIGNKNVFIYNNLIFNPSGFSGAGQHFAIYDPRSSLSGSNVPDPVVTDANLQIKGNVIYNRPGSAEIGVGDGSGCQDSNPTCNLTQLNADNSFNAITPELSNPSGGDFRPSASSNLLSVTTFSIPNFAGGDRESSPQADEGNLNNSFERDYSETSRTLPSTVGAYASINSSLLPPGGEENTDSDSPPTISKAKCSPRKININSSTKCEVSARDDKRVSKVVIKSDRNKTYRLKKSGNKYKATIKLSKKGKHLFTAHVTDSGDNETTKQIGNISVKK